MNAAARLAATAAVTLTADLAVCWDDDDPALDVADGVADFFVLVLATDDDDDDVREVPEVVAPE